MRATWHDSCSIVLQTYDSDSDLSRLLKA